ncbi:nucleotidyl transferase AbiEii/AbiGii toxin family protein [Pedobacter sp. ASV12]|uniref:nucleotidyl transferase AbiEii/AbiGii toxin family protein n=1 Tax=Pedobacter sp. ASV12 TaxID=2795120 RepID=UPI0018EAA749|nr:nucleotidyl transferase AbiEii/AbiGii toxin family protein [Pedobacter sp. ASV12]
MADERLAPFFLVGGTALSLQIGHRISIDIDLFSTDGFEETEMLEYLQKKYGFLSDYSYKNTLKGSIDNVKVDLITHAYPLLGPLLVEDAVRMASPLDIAAMKLNAITGAGDRLKDFIDLAYLSSIMPLRDMVAAFTGKYPLTNPVMAYKSLVYHDNINFDEPIQLMNKSYSWETVSKRLGEMGRRPEKLFGEISYRQRNSRSRGKKR